MTFKLLSIVFFTGNGAAREAYVKPRLEKNNEHWLNSKIAMPF